MNLMFVYSYIEKFWWRWMPGSIFVVPWPNGWVEVGEGTTIFSSDPNDHWRPWLEEHVGWQGWDWDWRISSQIDYAVEIKIRRSKEQYATLAKLRWV